MAVTIIALHKIRKTECKSDTHIICMKKENLKVSEARIDMGPVMKRMMFDSRGHVGRKDKRTSHIVVAVSE